MATSKSQQKDGVDRWDAALSIECMRGIPRVDGGVR